MNSRQKSIAIVVLVIAGVIALWVFLIKQFKSMPATTTPDVEFPDVEIPETETPTTQPSTNWLEELTQQLEAAGVKPTERTYREIVGQAEVVAAGLTEEKVSLPEVYAQTCPPLLYKVKYFDSSHNWVEKTVLATSSDAAAASLGLVAGYNCFVSSMSGQAESLVYHETGLLPAETVVASQEVLAQAAEQKAAEEAIKEVNAATVKAYTSYPTADKIGVSLLCSPPTGRSLTSSEKDRINALLAKDPAYVAELKAAYRAYAQVKGIGCSC